MLPGIGRLGASTWNALFAGHELGAENGAAIASLVETCKLNAINPKAYLADVFARIVTRDDGDPIDDLLPANWVDMNAAQAIFEMNDIAQTTFETLSHRTQLPRLLPRPKKFPLIQSIRKRV